MTEKTMKDKHWFFIKVVGFCLILSWAVLYVIPQTIIAESNEALIFWALLGWGFFFMFLIMMIYGKPEKERAE